MPTQVEEGLEQTQPHLGLVILIVQLGLVVVTMSSVEELLTAGGQQRLLVYDEVLQEGAQGVNHGDNKDNEDRCVDHGRENLDLNHRKEDLSFLLQQTWMARHSFSHWMAL